MSRSANQIACSTTFWSSRTLPGQRYRCSTCIASSEIGDRALRFFSRWSIRTGTSSRRSRSGGTWTWMTRSRYSRSSRNSPAETRSARLRLVAAMTRTFAWPDAAVRPDGLDFAGLEEAEEERLHAQAHLTDFVEEEGAAMGELQFARLVAIGAGEAALDVSEELRFEERLGQPRAVHGDERAMGAGRVHVDRARDQVLADAAFPGNENLGFAERRTPGHRQHFEHGGAGGDDVRLPAGHFLVTAFRMIPFRGVQHDTELPVRPGGLPPASCRASGAPALPVD